MDEQQERIANELKLSGITYHYKDDAEMPDLDECNFDLKEATIASACLANDPDLCARVLANRPSLWSMGEDYPGEVRPSRYARVFREDRSARMVWRAVQAQRIHIQVMKDRMKREIWSVQRDFFETARWLLLNVLFVRVKPQYGESMVLSVDEMRTVRESTDAFADVLWAICEEQAYVTESNGTQFVAPRHFRSVFSNVADCRKLRGLLLAKLSRLY